MYDTLSVLEHLESLALRKLSSLEGIELLAGSLRNLTITADPQRPDDNGQDAIPAASISKLARLKSLSIAGCPLRPPHDDRNMFQLSAPPRSSLQRLLNSLPASLQRLRLSGSLGAVPASAEGRVGIAATLRGGQCVSLELRSLEHFPDNSEAGWCRDPAPLTCEQLAQLAILLLPCRPMGQQLQLLTLPAVLVQQSDPVLTLRDRQVASQPDAKARLGELLRRASTVDVVELHVQDRAPLSAALILFGKPRRLFMGGMCLRIQVLQLAKAVEAVETLQEGPSAAAAYLRALEQELQSLWDGRRGAGGMNDYAVLQELWSLAMLFRFQRDREGL